MSMAWQNKVTSIDRRPIEPEHKFGLFKGLTVAIPISLGLWAAIALIVWRITR